MQMLCENKATTESREPKDLKNCSTNESDQLNNGGHGVCEYMGATYSSQHTVPDAEHSSTRCCPTHEMWELPTPLIVANRSQQGDEVYGIYPLVLKTGIPLTNNNIVKASHNSNEAYTAASIITHAQSKAVKQAHIRTSSLLSYNYHKAVPSNTDLTPAKPNTYSSSGTVAQKLRIGSYELNKICPTLLTQQKAPNKAQDYRRDMSSRSTSSSSQVFKRDTKRSILARGVQCYHSYFSRIYPPSAIREDKMVAGGCCTLGILCDRPGSAHAHVDDEPRLFSIGHARVAPESSIILPNLLFTTSAGPGNALAGGAA
ncbi:Glycosyl hydrolases family 32 protein [Dorcoceras hygrometricum]|uniref:Glycosyl hydrolases family 32 protein n=1 Tax=Dorcoceras hygrometricum TaxID=472368 RepID=A0A2Z7C2G4_9LAMI|nr:Glycosyl hydrolases family 32 protein [Dorcoceras hygrometricum]